MTPSKKPHVFIPDGSPAEPALAKTTHLAIAAHPDDLEIMAIDGIMRCYGALERCFAGCIVTDGRGSPRSGRFARVSDDEMVTIRMEEQKQAARIGLYGAQVFLGYDSEVVRQPQGTALADDLDLLLGATHPKVIYTHNLADKHETHVAVALRVIEAVRRMPADQRPEAVFGCEAWRSLDWLPDEMKVIFDVSGQEELQSALLNVYKSQIAGGKNYEKAVIGRRVANATFLSPYAADRASRLAFGMDMSPLARDAALEPAEFLRLQVSALAEEMREMVTRLTP